jgi:type II secretion system protein J
MPNRRAEDKTARDGDFAALCPYRWEAARAFTLIEAILALGISAIVLVAISGVFMGAMRLRERTFAAIDASLPVAQAMSTLRSDLQCAVGPSNILAGDFKCGAGDMGLTMGVSASPGVGVDFFTSTGIINDDQPWGDIQEVFYELMPPTDRNQPGKDLVRYVNRNLLSAGTPAAEMQWLMGGVDTLQFDCYDGAQWRPNWDTSSTDTNLPTAVRVTIRLTANSGAGTDPIQMVVPIISQTRTNAVPATVTSLP